LTPDTQSNGSNLSVFLHNQPDVNEVVETVNGLAEDRVMGLIALRRWTSLLTAENRTERLKELAQQGYIYDDTTLARNAMRSEPLNGQVETIEQQITGSERTIGEILNFSPRELGKLFHIAPSKAQLLQQFIEHTTELNSSNIEKIAKSFPFPITADNFFGQFIATGSNTPGNALRHLKLATPFFINVQSICEVINNGQPKFMTLEVKATKKKRDEDEDDVLSAISIEETYSALQDCINFTGSFAENPEKAQQFSTVQFPYIPDINTKHFSGNELPDVLDEIIDYCITGTVGPLLKKEELSKKRMKERQFAEKEHRAVNKKLAVFDKKSKDNEYEVMGAEESALVAERDELMKRITELNQQEQSIESVIQQLEESDNFTMLLHDFRKVLAAAKNAGRKPVFTFLPDDGDTGYTDPFVAEHFNKALSKKRKTKGFKEFLDSTVVMTKEMKYAIEQKSGPVKSRVRDDIVDFKVSLEDFNTSVQIITQGMVDVMEFGEFGEIKHFFIDYFKIPGVETTSDLEKRWSESFGKKKALIDDWLLFAFERATWISEDLLIELVGKLNSYGHSNVPQRCIEIAENRFHVDTTVLKNFKSFSKSYSPGSYGPPPNGFDSLTTIEQFGKMDISSIGMSAEVEELVHKLNQHGVVNVLDNTSMHPELALEVEGAKAENDVEKSSYAWGEYTRMTHRLTLALAHRIMRGDVPNELKDHSLVALTKAHKVDKVKEKLIQDFMGVAIGLTPDLSRINRALSELTMYDEDLILILESDNITDPTAFHKFITSLRDDYSIKVIVRSKKPITGLPRITINAASEENTIEKITNESALLADMLPINTPISESLIKHATERIYRGLRSKTDDGLNLVLQTLRMAAINASLSGRNSVTRPDIQAGISQTFSLPDQEEVVRIVDRVNDAMEKIPNYIIGQDEAVKAFGRQARAHFLNLSIDNKPQAALFCGPSGVGKTVICNEYAERIGVGFMPIDGSKYGHHDSYERLVGSSDQGKMTNGPLFAFLEQNETGIILLDEIEKMHPTVWRAFLNFIATGCITNGDGKTLRRPGIMVAMATNAGYEEIDANSEPREVRDILASKFINGTGADMPEFIRRLNPIITPAITKNIHQPL